MNAFNDSGDETSPDEMSDSGGDDEYPHPWGAGLGTVAGAITGVASGQIEHDPGSAGTEGVESGEGASSQ